MRLGQELVQRPEQRLQLLPKMLQSIEVLQLGTLDLFEVISKALSENEMLTIDPSEEGLTVRSQPSPEAEGAAAPQLERDRPVRGGRGASDGEDRKQMALLNTPAPPLGLREHLLQQVGLADLAPGLEAAVHHVIDHIDGETGWLLAGESDLAASFSGELEEARWAEAIAFVQQLDPPGVGGRGSIECLLLQLEKSNPHDALLQRLLVDFLEDLAKNRLPRVARKLGITIEDLRASLERLRGLDPRPGSVFQANECPYIRPEVIIEWCGDGEYQIRIDDSGLPQLKIDEQYHRMIKDRTVDTEVRGYLRTKYDSARWLIDAIEQRKSTLMRVARALFAQQREFLERGPAHVAPLRMRDLADELSLHVSTVSRTVAGKYVQSHWGIFPLRSFFSGGTRARGGRSRSRIEIKEAVRQIVAGEDGAAPLGDDQIVRELERREGLKVARRTVTKYRKELGIPSSWRRKRY